mmetsp:Transcript_5166/g.5066  ORF Transcript_5166/g.5066 Transcript_5166/m.5066 type:complete len:84 (+) Transcript_5166:346-597(+)
MTVYSRSYTAAAGGRRTSSHWSSKYRRTHDDNDNNNIRVDTNNNTSSSLSLSTIHPTLFYQVFLSSSYNTSTVHHLTLIKYGR